MISLKDVAGGLFLVGANSKSNTNRRVSKEKGTELMKIEDYRTEIDAIDDELLRLLNRRARLAVEIGGLKRVAGIPLRDPHRERQVLERMCLANDGPLNEEAVRKLFRSIIHETRLVQIKHVEAESHRLHNATTNVRLGDGCAANSLRGTMRGVGQR